jgi:hypothetical protein
MAEQLNREGVQIPSLGRIVMFLAETLPDGKKKIWPAIVTEVINVEDMLIRVTAFPPGEPARGIAAAVPYDGEAMLTHTWHWPPRV